MSAVDRFIDTNILLYLLSGDDSKADCAEEILIVGGVLSVQVLNEFASVAARKIKMTYPEIREVLAAIRSTCKIEPISEATHDMGLEIAERNGLSVYDSMIVASALIAGCNVLYSEDMQDGQLIKGQLRIQNPFR